MRFTGTMKATMEIPDALYRQVKAKSALEGRPVREVAVELFRRYVGLGEADLERGHRDAEEQDQIGGPSAPAWFGVLRSFAEKVERHDMGAVRESVARGIAADRTL